MISIRQAKNLKGKRILVRVDFNVPMKGQKVLDDSRLIFSLPTIKYLIEKKSKVILVSHLGRPEGTKMAKYSLKPVAKRLGKLLKIKILMFDDFRGSKVAEKINQMKGGQVAMLENIRFCPEEKNNKGTLGKDLADLADVFVLDGFAVAHRPDASVVGMNKYLPNYAGLLLEKEITALDKALKNPKHPFILILGGAKTETKIPVLNNLLPKADKILIGGAISNTYLYALGYEIGDSLYDKDMKKQILSLIKNKKIIIPVDLVVGNKNGKKCRVIKIKQPDRKICSKNEAVFDIGPETISIFADYIKSAKTLVWNGAMGYFEQKPYDKGTLSVARMVANKSKGSAFGIIGGGETIQAMEQIKMSGHVEHVSTGGGAMLEYLAGKKLPGIVALNN
jgi:3-phosphoglycerate kinase